jgi:antitoxin (DNA-binding transcriptional repressor) of toxin-antitoxin stability system
LRRHFADIEARLIRGERIDIRKRRKIIARLVPVRPKPESYPDFERLRRKIFAGTKSSQTGTQLIGEERGHY